MVTKVSLGCLGRPPGAPLGPSWPPTSLSWRALGRSWALLGALGRSWVALGTLLVRSWDALGRSWALLEALGRSWGALGTPLARFGTLQGSILGSPGSPQSYFKSILSNSSARKRTFRQSTESFPRTVREDSENQIQQRWIASSLLYLSPRS